MSVRLKKTEMRLLRNTAGKTKSGSESQNNIADIRPFLIQRCNIGFPSCASIGSSLDGHASRHNSDLFSDYVTPSNPRHTFLMKEIFSSLVYGNGRGGQINKMRLFPGRAQTETVYSCLSHFSSLPLLLLFLFWWPRRDLITKCMFVRFLMACKYSHPAVISLSFSFNGSKSISVPCMCTNRHKHLKTSELALRL